MDFGKFSQGFTPTFFKLAALFMLAFFIIRPMEEIAYAMGLVLLGIIGYSIHKGWEAAKK